MNNTAINTATAAVLTPAPNQQQPPLLEKVQDTPDSEKINAPQQPQKQQEETLSKEDARKITEELNSHMADLKTTLGFSIRDDLNNQVVIEIKNTETDELIKQLPPEELLKIREKMVEFRGLILDQNI